MCDRQIFKKNDDKFKYFSLKYNMTSKSIKFFLFFELVGQGLMFIEMYMNYLSVAAFFCFLALKKGIFRENLTLVNRYLLPVAMVTKLCKKKSNILSKMYTSNFNLYHCIS